MSRVHAVLLSLVVASAAGCADDFDPYNEVLGFRVLGMAADRPAVLTGETSVVSALLTDPDATFEWSWCPLSNGASDGYSCALTRDELQAIVDEAVGPNFATIPDFDLGTGPTASFEYSFPRELVAGLCQALFGGMDLPDLDELPSCEGVFEIKIRMVARAGGEEIIAVRDLDLVFDEQPPNQNPTLSGVSFRLAGEGDFTPLDDATPPELTRGMDYDLRLDIPSDSSEPFMEIGDDGELQAAQENLTVTWFFEAGDFDQQRSSFLVDGENTLEDLSANIYTAPLLEENDATESRLFFVLRDERGGLSFASRLVRFAQ